MPLSKRKKGGTGDASRRSRQSRAAFALSHGAGRRADVRVDYQPLTKQIDAIGYVEFDERGQRTVAARIAGRIDKLFVNETGQMVDEGDELASLYSPTWW